MPRRAGIAPITEMEYCRTDTSSPQKKFSVGPAFRADKPGVTHFALHSNPQFEGPATVRILGAPQTAGEPVSGTVLKFAGRRLTMTVASEVPPGSAVRIDVNGGLILGEVLGEAENAHHADAVSVAVDQVIPSLSDLARLVNSVCGERTSRPTESRTSACSSTSEPLRLG